MRSVCSQHDCENCLHLCKSMGGTLFAMRVVAQKQNREMWVEVTGQPWEGEGRGPRVGSSAHGQGKKGCLQSSACNLETVCTTQGAGCCRKMWSTVIAVRIGKASDPQETFQP